MAGLSPPLEEILLSTAAPCKTSSRLLSFSAFSTSGHSLLSSMLPNNNTWQLLPLPLLLLCFTGGWQTNFRVHIATCCIGVYNIATSWIITRRVKVQQTHGSVWMAVLGVTVSDSLRFVFFLIGEKKNGTILNYHWTLHIIILYPSYIYPTCSARSLSTYFWSAPFLPPFWM